MKLLSAVASTLLLVKGAASQEACPNSISLEEWGVKEITKLNGDTLTFRYAVVLPTSPSEQSILCCRLESDDDAYLAFGISPAGTMDGGEGIVGLPDAGTVKKYTLSPGQVEVMPAEQQTLMFTSISQENGKTVMEFAKYLVENGEHEILANGDNVFLYSIGSNNELGYHSQRGDFTLDFETTPKPSTSTTGAPTTLASAGTSSGSSGMDEVVIGVQRTLSPTPGAPPRGPAPSPTPEIEDPQAGAPNEVEDAVPTPAAEPTPTEPPNGAMERKIAGSMILGAGVVALWF